jgi:chitodextrinase
LKKSHSTLQSAQKVNPVAAGIVGVALVIIGFFVVTTRAASGAATLSVSPATAIVANGSAFSVQVYEDSGTATVNAVQANLTYPANSLTLTSISTTNSAFPLEAQSSGSGGSITMARAINGGTSPVTGKQLVATLNFTSTMATGTATVDFTTGSAVVSSVDNTALILTTQSGTYQPDTAAPTTPTALHTTGSTGTSIAIAWAASTDNVGVTGYNVYRDGVKITTTAAGTLAYNDTGLGMGTLHSYQVSAIDAAGNESTKSPAIQVTTPDTAAPTVPGNPTAAAPAYNQVTLSWGASTDTGGSGLAGYRIYRNGATTALASTTGLTYTDNTVAGSTAYTYQITAYDGAGNESGKTTAASITTPAPPDTTPPTTPGSFQSTNTGLTAISLSWTASTDNKAVTGYLLSRNGTQIATIPSTAATSYNDSSLTYGTTYNYTLKATDAAGNLSNPATLSVTTLPLKSGDLNLDNQINVFDLSILLSNWQMSGTVADLNHDNTVNIFDLSILISNWGK